MMPSDTEELLYRVADGIGLVTLNRPAQRNALTFAMYDRLAEICASVPPDGSVRAIVVTGAGGKAFAAGTDIALFRDFKSADDGVAYERSMSSRIGRIEACAVPTIAAISGACTGGGAAIAACCDLRLGTQDMKFGFPIARTLGNCLSAGSLSKMVALVGAARVTEMIFTARLYDATECQHLGLVTEVHADHAAVLARALALAGEIARLAPITLRVTKQALQRLRERAGPAQDEDLIRAAYGSADFREGLTAFLEKRAPHWRGV
jgi:enoyl-CoA hydratase